MADVRRTHSVTIDTVDTTPTALVMAATELSKLAGPNASVTGFLRGVGYRSEDVFPRVFSCITLTATWSEGA